MGYEPLGTHDIDVAVPAELPATDKNIRQRLLENDFREELLGETQPPDSPCQGLHQAWRQTRCDNANRRSNCTKASVP